MVGFLFLKGEGFMYTLFIDTHYTKSLKYDDCLIGIRDKNGVFVGRFNHYHELVGDYFYLSNHDYELYPEKIIIDDEINLDMVYEYLKDKNCINPHLLKPIYVKKIEVDK